MYVDTPLKAIGSATFRDIVYLLQVGTPLHHLEGLPEAVRQPIISVHKVTRAAYERCRDTGSVASSILNPTNRIICLIENTFASTGLREYFEHNPFYGHQPIIDPPQFNAQLPPTAIRSIEEPLTFLVDLSTSSHSTRHIEVSFDCTPASWQRSYASEEVFEQVILSIKETSVGGTVELARERYSVYESDRVRIKKRTFVKRVKTNSRQRW